MHRERDARRELGERERAAAQAADQRAAEAERCSEHAATHGLPAAIDEAGLRELEQATHRYGAGAGGVATAVERAREAEARRTQLEERLGELRA